MTTMQELATALTDRLELMVDTSNYGCWEDLAEELIDEVSEELGDITPEAHSDLCEIVERWWANHG